MFNGTTHYILYVDMFNNCVKLPEGKAFKATPVDVKIK